jgi:hypothetical protein
MQLVLAACRAGAIAGMGGDRSADPFNEMMGQLCEMAGKPNDNG